MNQRSCLVLPTVALVLLTSGCSSKSSEPPASYYAPASSGSGGSHQTAPDASTCRVKTGYERVSALDTDSFTDDGHVAMVLDQDGSPMVAWVAYDRSATTLYFAAYDGDTCRWLPRVAIDQVGNLDATNSRQVSMTRDASTGRLGIAYQVIDAQYNRTVMLAQSDDNGATWSKETVAENPPRNTSKGVSLPAVVMKNGTTYVAYYQFLLYSATGNPASNNSGFVLMIRNGVSGTFVSKNVPAVSGASLPGSEPYAPALAVADSGDVGFATFALSGDTATNLQLIYYQSTDNKSSVVFDSKDQPNSQANVSLVFQNNSPRLAAYLDRDRANTNQSMIWSSSSDDGTVWSTPIQLPMDGGDAMGPDLALAAFGDKTLSVASNYASGSGIHQCGAPKISTLTDDGSTWTTCGPAINTIGAITYAGRYVQLAYAPNGKRVAAFSVVRQGVWVWREP